MLVSALQHWSNMHELMGRLPAEPVHAHGGVGMDVALGVCGLHAGLDAGKPASFSLSRAGSNTWHLGLLSEYQYWYRY